MRSMAVALSSPKFWELHIGTSYEDSYPGGVPMECLVSLQECSLWRCPTPCSMAT